MERRGAATLTFESRPRAVFTLRAARGVGLLYAVEHLVGALAGEVVPGLVAQLDGVGAGGVACEINGDAVARRRRGGGAARAAAEEERACGEVAARQRRLAVDGVGGVVLNPEVEETQVRVIHRVA